MVDTLPYEPWRERGTVVDGAFRWRLGVRPLDLDAWFEFGPDADGSDGWIAQKGRLLDEHRPTVFAVLDDVEEECDEVLDAVTAALGRPARSQTGGTHPLEVAARLVPEDLVVMVERDGRTIFGGGVVCFPNRWDLRSKIGRSLAEVHAPVAGLNDQLEPSIDRFLDRLTPERSWWRLGWGIIDVPDGYTPLDGTGPARPEDTSVDDLFVRVERETLRRFPRTGCVLFTIRTYVAPISTVLRDAESAASLAQAVAAMDPGVRDYKDLLDHVEPLVARVGSS